MHDPVFVAIVLPSVKLVIVEFVADQGKNVSLDLWVCLALRESSRHWEKA